MAAIPEPVEVQFSDKVLVSTEDNCKPMEVEFNRIDVMKDHWRVADERFEAVFLNNPFGLFCWCSVVVCEWLEEGEGTSHMFPSQDTAVFQLCCTCNKSLDANKILA